MTKFDRDMAEGELIDLLRGHDLKNYTVTITRLNDVYTVTAVDHETPGTNPPSNTCKGVGMNFTDAWLSQEPTWAKA